MTIKPTLRNILVPAVMAFLVCACGGEKKEAAVGNVNNSTAIDLTPVAKGDSALYGLACDGCTDSVVVFLPNGGGDPDTFDIITARRNHRVFGHPRIGDKLSVLVSKDDRQEALTVIDIDDLSEMWCYLQKPQFRDMKTLPKRVQRRMMENMPDSMRQAMLVPREFGMEIKRNNSIRNTGMMMQATTTDDQSPIEYPHRHIYSEWRLYNGRIIFSSETPKGLGGRRKSVSDTAEIVMLMKDSLILQFSYGTMSYYKKNNSEKK